MDFGFGGCMILKLNDTRQISDYDCGASALQTVFAYYDVDTVAKELMNELGTNEKEGTSIIKMIEVAKGYGFNVKYGSMDYDVLKKAVSKGFPVIVLVQAWAEKYITLEDWKETWSEGHYVVVIGFEDDIVIFEDPSSFKRTWMTKEEFLNRWHDEDYGTKLYNWGMILYGKKPRKTNLEHME